MSIGRFPVTVDDWREREQISRVKRYLRFSSRVAIMIATEAHMGQLIVRNLEDAVKRKLQRRAARHGRSMEEEIRDILRDAVRNEGKPRKGLGTEIAELFKGIELEEPIQEFRGFDLKPPKFD
jgi:plasmid stability protein